NYYPFGMKHKGYNTVSTSTNPALKYKYNGKELQDELGLNMYDYGARNYDPSLGRWMNIDPLAELSRRFSPYTYALNNPVYFIDPDGMLAEPPVGFEAEDATIYKDKDGSWIYSKEDATWYGMFGAKNISNRVQLDDVVVEYDSNEGTYFDKDNKGSGEYGPYIPDAVGISLTVSVNTGIFGSFGGNIGGAIDVHNNVEGFVGGYGDIGYNGSLGIPKITFGASIDFHDSYNGNDGSVLANSIPGGVLGNLGGESQRYNGGLGLTGGYSYSLDPNTQQKADYGIETKSIGLGFGINAQAGRARNWTFTEIYNNLTN
uniref:RHS repeat-associated core domain-containing protein n=1 Tax=Flavobacterium ajazii TaxID=2692318 RepID=UPI00293BEB0E